MSTKSLPIFLYFDRSNPYKPVWNRVGEERRRTGARRLCDDAPGRDRPDRAALRVGFPSGLFYLRRQDLPGRKHGKAPGMIFMFMS